MFGQGLYCMGETAKGKLGVENNLRLCFSDSERDSGPPIFLEYLHLLIS
jgi:hypothetical protein